MTFKEELPSMPEQLLEGFVTTPPRVILLIGSGVSQRVLRPNGHPFPSWKGLLLELFEWAKSQGFTFTDPQVTAFHSLVTSGAAKALLNAGGWLRSIIGDNFFQEFLSETFSFIPSTFPPLYALLKKLPIKGIVTFNYDCLLEAYFEVPSFFVSTEQDSMLLARIQQGASPLFILKAHGDVNRAETIVFGHDDYRKVILDNRAYRKVFSTLFEQHIVLVIGLGMEDPDLDYLFDEVITTFPSAPLSVYAIVPEGKVNPIVRDIWLKERKIRLITYTCHNSDHLEVDAFLEALTQEISTKKRRLISPTSEFSQFAYTNPHISLLRASLAKTWEDLNHQLTISMQPYLIAADRGRAADDILVGVYDKAIKSLHIPDTATALVARGSYGKGYLSKGSDIDITLLHQVEFSKKAEAVFSRLTTELQDVMNSVSIPVRPVINTIDECFEHWKESLSAREALSSLVSFASSRLIVGSSALHYKLREKWKEYVLNLPLSSLISTIRDERLSIPLEHEWPEILNIKTCAGGLLELMLVYFLEEILLLRNADVSLPSGSRAEMQQALNQLLLLREYAYSISKTVVLRKSDLYTVEKIKHVTQFRKIIDNSSGEFHQARTVIRSRLISLLETRYRVQ
jgi:hypothetical protein